MPGSSTLVATWPGGTLATLFPNSFGTVSEVGGRGRVQANNTTNALVSATTYTFDGFYGRVYPDDTSGGFTYSLLGYYADESNRISIFYIDGDALYFEVFTAGVQNATTLAFNPTAHAWWSIIPSGGNLLYRTSPDGITWTVQRTVAAPSWVSATTAGYLKFELSTNTGTGLAELGYLNTLGAVPSATFPYGPLAIRGEMLIGGTWTNVTSRVRSDSNIVIERGYRNESGGSWSPGQARFTLNNRDGFFSNRAPAAVNYGKLPPATPVRFSVDEPDGMALDLLNDYSGARNAAVTADKSTLDIVGDLEIRMDLKPQYWTVGATAGGQVLLTKYLTTGNQRSYALTLTRNGNLQLWWSSAGTGVTGGVVSTAPVPFANGTRGSVRVLFDVNNGASGRTITFYTGPSITGPWTQLGTPVTQAGVTSIFSGTADLMIGAMAASFFANHASLTGRVYRAQVYSGLTGTTLVADPNFAAQAAGTTSFSDGVGTPNTWAVPALNGINASNYRFYGEIGELPQRWDTSGTDVYVPTVAADILRRITQGQDAIDSPLFRYLSSRTDTLGYWPLEDATGATSLTQIAPNAERGRFNDVTFAPDAGLPASKSVVTFGSAASFVTSYAVRRGAVATNYSSFAVTFKFPTVPGSEVQLVSLGSSGTIQRWTLSLNATQWIVRGFDGNGNSVGSLATGYGAFMSPARWTSVRLQTHVVGSFNIMELAWIDIQNQVVAGITSTTEFPGTVNGLWTGYNFAAAAGLSGLQLAHIFMGQADLSVTSQFYQAATGYAGETAGTRMIRLAGEEGVPFHMIGDTAATEPMGAQPIDTFTNIMEQCAAVDGGLLFSRRQALALAYRSYAAMYDQNDTVLSYANAHLSGSLDPTDDDQTLRNDVTITRTGGATARATKETGARSIAAAGSYRSAYSLNSATDDQTQYLAEQAVYLGTWDELRYPRVEVELARAPFVANAVLSAAVAATDIGQVLDLTGLPAWLPPDDVELLVRGHAETLRNRNWNFVWNNQAYGPWRATSRLQLAAGNYNLAGARNSQINVAMTSTDTTARVVSPAGMARWGSGAVGQNVTAAGEVMTVSAIANAVADAFGRTASSSFGSADAGGAYTTSGGSASDYSVSGGLGRMLMSTVNVSRQAFLAGVNTSEQDLYCTVAVSAVATGAALIPYVTLRRFDGSNQYRFEAVCNTGGSADARIRTVIGGTLTTVATASGVLTYGAGTLLRIRAQTTGSTLRMKLWLAAGLEPPGWTLTFTDSSVTTGAIALGGTANTGNTNVSPEIRFDDMLLQNVQQFTVVRSVNTVVKAQTAGTAIDLQKRFFASK